MDTKNAELNAELNTESSEEPRIFSEEEAEQIYTKALIVCVEALQDLQKDVQDLRDDFSALYQRP